MWWASLKTLVRVIFRVLYACMYFCFYFVKETVAFLRLVCLEIARFYRLYKRLLQEHEKYGFIFRFIFKYIDMFIEVLKKMGRYLIYLDQQAYKYVYGYLVPLLQPTYLEVKKNIKKLINYFFLTPGR